MLTQWSFNIGMLKAYGSLNLDRKKADKELNHRSMYSCWKADFKVFTGRSVSFSSSGIPAAGTRARSTGNDSAANAGWVSLKRHRSTRRVLVFSVLKCFTGFYSRATLSALFPWKRQKCTGTTRTWYMFDFEVFHRHLRFKYNQQYIWEVVLVHMWLIVFIHRFALQVLKLQLIIHTQMLWGVPS